MDGNIEASEREKEEGSPRQKNQNPIEALSKDEIVLKYKGLLGIAKKAKQAKDELTEENRRLMEALSRCETQKEADKKALLTMKEMLEEFTANKLKMVTQICELENKSKTDDEQLMQLRIENESLKRQLNRLTEDNDSLLNDIDRMEHQLKQVNLLGVEQKENLALLELEVNKLKEAEGLNASLQEQMAVTLKENEVIKAKEQETKEALEQLTDKYKKLKEVNSAQRSKFNSLKERFVEVLRKLKNLKECKRILLETQHEYSDAVSKWQKEIIKASQLLCAQMNGLKTENEKLLRQLAGAENFTKTLDQDNSFVFKLENAQAENEQLKEKFEKALNTIDLDATDQAIQSTAIIAESDILPEFKDEKVNFETSSKEVETITKLEGETSHTEEQDLLQNFQELTIKLKDKEDQLNATGIENQQLKLEFQNQVTELEMKLEAQAKRIDEMDDQNIKCQQEKLHLNEVIKTLETEKTELLNSTEELKHLSAENERLIAINSELNKKLNEMKKMDEKLLELQKKIISLEDEKLSLQVAKQEKEDAIKIAEEANKDCQNETVVMLQSELQISRQSYEDLLSRYEQKEREHTDLLGEMRELNEALKARGDLISRQQEKQQEMSTELKKTTTKLKQIEDRLNEKEQHITEKDSQLLAIKTEINDSRNKVKDLEQACIRNEEQLRSLTEELNGLRTNNSGTDISVTDVPDNQSDILSTSTFSRTEELNRMRELDESFEEKYNKLRGLAVKLKKKLQDQTAIVAEMEKQQTSTLALKKQVEENNKKIADHQHEREQMQKLVDMLKAEVQKLKSSRKQANVLNLEIEAAEKSLSDVSSKLAIKISEVDALNEVLTTKENTIVQLRKEIAILETAKEAECGHSKELKEQIDRLQMQIKDAIHNNQTTQLASKELEQSYENSKLDLEDLRLQLANSTSEHKVLLESKNTEIATLEQKLIATEDELKHTQVMLKNAERSLEDMRVEYLEYKVKAQAVLRKNQSKDTTKERELEEELLALRAMEKKLQTNAQSHIIKIEESDKKIEMLKEDNESLQRRNKELLNVIEELRQQTDSLAQENRNKMEIYQESLKNHRQQIETLDSCHKQQLKELENSYQRQIEQLKCDLAKAARTPIIIGAAAATTGSVPRGLTNATLMNTSLSNASEQSKIDFLLMEREDAEGSEEAAEALATIAANRKISNASRRSNHDFMPLDELLNAPYNAIGDSITTITLPALESSDYSEKHELQATKERLQIQESRVRHLTALLAENEQDLAKLTQMNDMLKEELRRQERSVEREQHMHNSEYLKNVVIKFITLNNSDERMRLVPVLNTILKLSRSESEMLNCVAKGQKVPTENNRGWSSFLSNWSNNNN